MTGQFFLRWVERNARVFGIAGPMIIAVGTLVSLWRYHLGGGDSHPFYYWPVSGLGDHNVAPWPMVFNTCVISGALLMGLFLLGVGLQLKQRRTWAAVIVGMLASLGFAGVGVFPSAPETLDAHFVAAGIAFVAAAALGVAFVGYLLLHPAAHFPRWLLYPSLCSVASTGGLITAIVMFVSGNKVQVLTISLAGIQISGIILLEWLAFVSLNAWIALCALGMRPHETAVAVNS